MYVKIYCTSSEIHMRFIKHSFAFVHLHSCQMFPYSLYGMPPYWIRMCVLCLCLQLSWQPRWTIHKFNIIEGIDFSNLYCTTLKRLDSFKRFELIIDRWNIWVTFYQVVSIILLYLLVNLYLVIIYTRPIMLSNFKFYRFQIKVLYLYLYTISATEETIIIRIPLSRKPPGWVIGSWSIMTVFTKKTLLSNENWNKYYRWITLKIWLRRALTVSLKMMLNDGRQTSVPKPCLVQLITWNFVILRILCFFNGLASFNWPCPFRNDDDTFSSVNLSLHPYSVECFSLQRLSPEKYFEGQTFIDKRHARQFEEELKKELKSWADDDNQLEKVIQL